MTIAPPPPLPSPDAEPDVWARYFQELENYRAATARLHAQAQADTATAMNRNAAALEAMSAQPTTRADLVWQAALAHPHVTGLTDLNIVDNCIKLVDAYASRMPGAVAP